MLSFLPFFVSRSPCYCCCCCCCCCSFYFLIFSLLFLFPPQREKWEKGVGFLMISQLFTAHVFAIGKQVLRRAEITNRGTHSLVQNKSRRRRQMQKEKKCTRTHLLLIESRTRTLSSLPSFPKHAVFQTLPSLTSSLYPPSSTIISPRLSFLLHL